jgi:glycosyltransferase involved in cell wall biosynthesis
MTFIACCVLLFWVLVSLDFKRWWPASHTLGMSQRQAPKQGGRGVVVVIPARNEAGSLPATLPALLAQSEDFSRLVLVDDESSDNTRAVADSIAGMSAEPEKTLIEAAASCPSGWSGKIHALQCGLHAGLGTEQGDSEWLLFTDADIQHPPGSIRTLLEKADDGGYDLVSVMVRLRVEGFWERLLVPPFIYFFQFLYPFRRVADPDSQVAAAAGGAFSFAGKCWRK